MIEVQIDVDEATRRVNAMAEKLRDMRPVFLEFVIPLLQEMEVNLFESEGVIANPPWSPLSPRTLEEKARLGFGDMPIMRRTDRLYDSLAMVNADTELRVTGAEMRWGTTVPYAQNHQLGIAARQGQNLPVRQVIPDPLPEEVVDQITEAVDAWIAEV